MLKAFRVSNFRSLVNVEFRPVGSNLIIGPNNVGKTSLCSALRFVSMSASNNLEGAALNSVVDTWNIANVYVKAPTLRFDLSATIRDGEQSFDFEYSLEIEAKRDRGNQGVALRSALERLSVTGGRFAQTVLLQCIDGQGRLLNEERFQEGSKEYIETLMPGDATMLSRLYDAQTNHLAILFRLYVQSWWYISLSPQALRSPLVVSDKAALRPDGANLTKVMYTLHNERPRVEKRIIAALKAIEPKADLLSFVSPDPTSVYMFLEDSEGNRFGTYSMSDATLRYIVLAYLIYAYGEDRAGQQFSPLIMVEQPEDGLYVGQLRHIFEKIDLSGDFGQFIFTSHSPYFIDLWEKNLAGVHLFKPGIPSSVLVQPDAAKLERLLKEMPLGELHYREMLS